MKNCKELFYDLMEGLTLDEPPEELESISYILLQDCFDINRNDILSERQVAWTAADSKRFYEAQVRLNSGEPVQYIAGKAFFAGRFFQVSPSVLIPRPETEELVGEVVRYVKNSSRREGPRILDIGTGSGCIPVTLALEVQGAEVIATDVSEKALAVARQNVLLHKVAVRLLLHDVLAEALPFSKLDVIVSNPPYVTHAERNQMKSNVVDFEPHTALFVPDDDPLLFYRTIASKGMDVLLPGGLIAFEGNARYAKDVAGMLENLGYEHVTVLPDVSGLPRIIKAFMGKI